MEPTTRYRPLSDAPRDLRPTARLTVVALVLWAVAGVFHATMAVGYYEHRITVVTHGSADVWPAWVVYELFDHLLPYRMANSLADWSWILASLVAAAAFIIWLRQARPNAARSALAPSWWACVLVTLLLHGLGWLYNTVIFDGGTALDTRWVAYPLWTAATVMTVVTATQTARIVRRITRAVSAA